LIFAIKAQAVPDGHSEGNALLKIERVTGDKAIEEALPLAILL
jgi:hypothetical protein